jgi:ABC-2 type transport system permease protein
MTTPHASPVPTSLLWILSDSWEMTRRMMLHFWRIPYTLIFTAMQPIMFALLFRYVFGGSFDVPGDYVDFLMPGVFAMAVGFGAITTAIGISADMQSGAIDRFRSLPMSRAAFLIGHTTADLLRGSAVVLIVVAIGFLIGFDFHTSWGEFIGGIGVILAFSYALIWASALIGIISPNAQTAEGIVFTALFPLTFASSAFTTTDSMPDWLRVFTEHQPFSVAVDACRALMLGGDTTQPVTTALIWIAAMVVVFVPVAVYRYQRTV